MNISELIPRIRILFATIVIGVFALLFSASVTFREGEIAALKAVERFISTVGYSLQYAAAGMLSSSAFGVSAQNAQARAVPVFVYHGIVSKPDRFSMTEETFKDQMFALKRAGYETIRLEEFIAFQRGERSLPDKSFLLTFDDGRTDSYEGADPILSALGFTAVMFVSTDASLGEGEHNSYYLDEDELKRMIASGRWEIGSHAIQQGGGFVPISATGVPGNFLSNKKWRDDVGRLETNDEYAARVAGELADSKKILEERLGISVRAFSYPFGDWGQQGDTFSGASDIIATEISKNYTIAFRQVWPGDDEPTYNYVTGHPYHLLRIESDTRWTGEDLVSFMDRARPKPVPYRDTFDGNTGWKSTWGNVSVEQGRISLAASSTSSGAFAFLDGARDWENYSVSARTAWTGGSHFSLAVRYQNGERMALCTFSDQGVRIEERVDGSSSVLAEISRPAQRVGIEVSLGAIVVGNRVGCTENGRTVVIGRIDNSLESGGVGVRIWDEQLGLASVRIDSLEVTPAERIAGPPVPTSTNNDAAGTIPNVPNTGNAPDPSFGPPATIIIGPNVAPQNADPAPVPPPVQEEEEKPKKKDHRSLVHDLLSRFGTTSTSDNERGRNRR